MARRSRPTECLESRDTDFTADEDETPALNQAFYYLVRGVNGCDGGAAPAGTDSSGAERTPGLCSVD